MVQGFNHNIKHKGKLYHIQTEDSGRDNPHIITHVFVGGNILATKKTSYADIAKADRLEEIVKELMEEQHKSVLRNLINGVYDNPERQATEIGEPATLASTGARVAPNGGTTEAENEADATKETKPPPSAPATAVKPPTPPKAPASPTARPPAPPPTGARATPPARPATPPAPPPAAKGNEKSLDEIILSYLADRDGE